MAEIHRLPIPPRPSASDLLAAHLAAPCRECQGEGSDASRNVCAHCNGEGDCACNDCRDEAAEAQDQQRYEDFHGGSGPLSLDEQHRRAWEQKQGRRW